jgi:hypothetical protein
VAVEIGLAVILLAGAGLMMQSVWRLLQVDPGFNTRNILTTQVALSPTVAGEPAGYPACIPANARACGGDSRCPVGGHHVAGSSRRERQRDCLLAGRRTPASSGPDDVGGVLCRHSPYPSVMQIPLRRGRFFTERDNLASPSGGGDRRRAGKARFSGPGPHRPADQPYGDGPGPDRRRGRAREAMGTGFRRYRQDPRPDLLPLCSKCPTSSCPRA